MPVRLGLAHVVLIVLALAACSRAPVDPSAGLGCGPVDALAAVTDQKTIYVLVGEPYETMEGPVAFAELACQLAARQPKDKPLWVGLSEYIGGSTDAERALRQRLRDLKAKGAALVVGDATAGHTTGASRRDEAEQRWAATIQATMSSANASRALLLLPRRDAVAMRVIADEARIVDYTPMALFLPEGSVVTLELGQTINIGAPTIRIYRDMANGYMGQLALATLTPAPKTPEPTPPSSPPAAAARPPDRP